MTGLTRSTRASGNAGNRNFAWAHGGPAGASRVGAPAASSQMRASSPSVLSNARSSTISPGRAVSDMQGSRMNSSRPAGSRAVTRMSGASTLGNSSLSHTGLNNRAFASARLGSNTLFGHSALTGSTFGHPFGGRGFDRGFGHGFGRGFHDHDFNGFGCFGCGFGFGFGPGFGLGFGWGWGLGWGWGGWWNPWWWGPPVAYYDPWWGWAPPPPVRAPGGYSTDYGNSESSYNAIYINPSSGHGNSDSLSASLNSEPLGSPNTNPLSANMAESTPTILIYLKDNTMLAASDY